MKDASAVLHAYDESKSIRSRMLLTTTVQLYIFKYYYTYVPTIMIVIKNSYLKTMRIFWYRNTFVSEYLVFCSKIIYNFRGKFNWKLT